LIHGKEAPTGIDDPHIDLEPDFVILLSDGSHFLIPNMPVEVKKKYIYKKVKINGKVNFEHRSIEAEEFKVKGRLKYKTVWTNREYKMRQKWLKWQQDNHQRGWTPDDTGG
jgi:hypothetical protein